MALCYSCNKHYIEPEDEQGDHPCVYCGYYWLDEEESDEED
jgi:hypothetical protein